MFRGEKTVLQRPTKDQALPGRPESMPHAKTHVVTGAPMDPPFSGMELAMFGLGCFWGAERIFWQMPGVHTTMVGYAGGHTPNPTYEEVCSGMTGHNEVVRVAFDPLQTIYKALLEQFWQAHDPTQGDQQGNDRGTQYRSGIYCYSADQRQQAITSRDAYGQALATAGRDPITTEICDVPEFYYAEDYHQQYLAKNPHGYCGLGGTGVCYPTSV